ncbi:F-box domain, Leucine-rich repeat domain, L domain-like protein [Artemisia annua]|uniref:F-box domain, Leucine-rich repeat domain, L domain-like protein n=1 Tax=Artemisia annua TaxID=35608 RepID=A0A2U1N338_ARTAN|nr:F-box domain, Leucine-rich repeat domain, L domain-like protein [Artemisia annua]
MSREDDSSSFDPLPDEVVLQIFRKIIHLEPYSLADLFPNFSTGLPFKWKIKCGKNLDSVIFLSPNSVYHSKKYVNENAHEEEDMELTSEKRLAAMECLDHAVLSHVMLVTCIKNIPLLEKVTLADSGKRCRISLNREKIAEMRGLTSPYDPIRWNRMSKCYVPLLELPVSGYVLKEAAFNEALMEIFKKHAARFERQNGFASVAFL